MKSFFTQLVLIAGLSVLAVSCGGSKGSGGGSNGVGYSNLNSTNLDATGAHALAEANAWYANTVEPTSQQQTGVGNITKTKYVSNSSSNCVTKHFLGIPYQWCTSSSNSNSQGTLISTQTGVNLNALSGQIINTKGNAELNSMFAGSVGTLIGGNVQGAVIQLDFLRADGVVLNYFIDRNLHSLSNPAQITENQATGRSDIRTIYTRTY